MATVADECGVLYLALERPSLAAVCLLSIASLRRSGYSGEVLILSDLPPELWLGARPLRATVRRLDRAENQVAKVFKTRLGRLTPFERTLYLDCDTLVCRSLRGLWTRALPPDLPVAMARDRAPTLQSVLERAPAWGNPQEWAETALLCGPGAPHFNSGVVYWATSSASEEFFKKWEEEFLRYCATDQAPLARAISRTACPPASLGQRLNVQTGQTAWYPSAIIRHFNGIRGDRVLDAMVAAYRRIGDEQRRRRSGLFSTVVCTNPPAEESAG